MIRIAMCDDEPAIIHMLEGYLKNFSEKFEIELQMESYTDGESLLSSKEKYDIMILDVGIAEDSGIRIGREVRKTDKRVTIIYLTGFLDYMKDAFQVHAFEYLTKPVQEERVHQVLFEAISYGKLDVSNSLTFHTKTGIVTLQVEDIMFFEYSNRSVIVYDSAGQQYELPGEKISAIAKKMRPYHFEVSHKSFVVNLHQVQSIKGYSVFMKHGLQVPLSQLYSKAFRKNMHDYINSRI